MTEAPEPQEQEAEAPAPSSKAGKFLTIGLILVGLLSGGAAGAFAIGPTIAKRSIASDSGATPKHDAKADSASAEQVAASMLVLENLVLNPAGSGGTRFLLFSVGLQMQEPSGKELMHVREVEVRDEILRVIGARHVEELTDVTTRLAIRESVRVALDSLFHRPMVKAVFFPQFVIQ